MSVYEADILELDRRLVRLKGDKEVSSDVLLCGTSWTSTLDLFDKDLLVKLDLPHPLEHEPAEVGAKWAWLEKEADQKVLDRFPMLANPPVCHWKPIDVRPYRLYNGIAPLRDDSIAFIGHVLVGNYFIATECQATWATAYLDKRLVLASYEERQAKTALFTAWCRQRYLSNCERGNWLPFDMIPYTNKLLQELGLSSHRKGWLQDFLAPNIFHSL